jgi:F-type H+-transporting ATPase subunit gamma
MQSTRDIQRKIRTVRNIQQICKAMKTVSSIKLRKAEERIVAARPYADAMRAMTAGLTEAEATHPLLAVRDEVRHVGLVAISADKGLAGGYNTRLLREVITFVHEQTAPVRVFPIGRKVADAARRLQYEVASPISPMGSEPQYRTFADLADAIGQQYALGELDRVVLVFTLFGGPVTVQQLLPITAPEGVEPAGDVIYEPNPAAILNELLPRYLRTMLHTAVLSAIAAEHAARVTAMTLATENAEELIAKLTMDYNKSRQAAITGELGDIVGAAEALR